MGRAEIKPSQTALETLTLPEAVYNLIAIYFMIKDDKTFPFYLLFSKEFDEGPT